MNKERNYIPIPEAQTHRLRTTVRLPFGLEEQMGINIGKIHQLLQIAGIKKLKIVSDENGMTSKSNVSIIGIQKDGAAMGGYVKSEQIPECIYNFDEKVSRAYGSSKRSQWMNVEIKLNVEEIKHRLLEDNVDLRKVAPWVQVINSGLRHNLLVVGNKHLLTGLTKYDKHCFLLLYANAFLSSADAHFLNLLDNTFKPHLPDIGWFIYVSLLTGLSYNTVIQFLTAQENNNGSGFRHSLFIGFELDRALVFNIMMLKGALVKELNSDNHRVCGLR